MVETKNKNGRPLKFKKEDIQVLFELYVEECVKNGKILTKAGWLFKLGMSRENYREYKAREGFVDTLRQIEFLIEDAWVQRLTETGSTGAIFYLKNAFKEDYKDRTETSLTFENEEAKEKADKLVKEYLGNTGTNRNQP